MGPILTTILIYAIAGILGALLALGLNALIRRKTLQAQASQAAAEATQLRQGATREAENLRKEAKLEAKELFFQGRAELEREQKEKQSELGTAERRLLQR